MHSGIYVASMRETLAYFRNLMRIRKDNGGNIAVILYPLIWTCRLPCRLLESRNTNKVGTTSYQIFVI